MASYVIQHETLKAMADEVRVLADSSDDMNPSEMTANVAQANADVAAQADLIAQIRTALDGKASGGGGGGGTEEIENIIDQSGVLGTTDETVTVTEKVEQLIDLAEDSRLWGLVALKGGALDNTNSPFRNWAEKTIPKINFSQLTPLRYTFFGSSIEYIDYYINSSSCSNLGSCLFNTVNLKTMVGIDCSSAQNISDLLNGSGIESIQKAFDLTNVIVTNKAFYCSNLKNILFEEKTINVSIAFTSPVLSDKYEEDEDGNVISVNSIESILKGLAPVETAQVLTVHQTVYNKILDSEYLSELLFEAMDKGWDISY